MGIWKISLAGIPGIIDVYKNDCLFNMSEYAPEYTKRERIVFILKLLALATPIYLMVQFWLADWIADFTKNAHCFNYGSINGMHLVFYGALTFLPLLLGIILFLFEGIRGIKIIKLGQNPLPDEKVFTPTKYKYGAAAKVQPFGIFSVIVFCIGLSIWGGFKAHEQTREIKPCTVNISLNQTRVNRAPDGEPGSYSRNRCHSA
ncbi:MAG: hypothetical protein ABW092_07355 [Candidatus Thiodiazotropha sp.]